MKENILIKAFLLSFCLHCLCSANLLPVYYIDDAQAQNQPPTTSHGPHLPWAKEMPAYPIVYARNKVDNGEREFMFSKGAAGEDQQSTAGFQSSRCSGCGLSQKNDKLMAQAFDIVRNKVFEDKPKESSCGNNNCRKSIEDNDANRFARDKNVNDGNPIKDCNDDDKDDNIIETQYPLRNKDIQNKHFRAKNVYDYSSNPEDNSNDRSSDVFSHRDDQNNKRFLSRGYDMMSSRSRAKSSYDILTEPSDHLNYISNVYNDIDRYPLKDNDILHKLSTAENPKNRLNGITFSNHFVSPYNLHLQHRPSYGLSLDSSPSFNVHQDAMKLYNAIQNSDDATPNLRVIIDILTQRSASQRRKIANVLNSEYDIDLMEEFQNLPTNVKYYLMTLMKHLPDFNERVFYHKWLSQVYGRSKPLFRILSSLTKAAMQTLGKAYKQLKANVERQAVMQLQGLLEKDDINGDMDIQNMLEESVMDGEQIISSDEPINKISLKSYIFAKMLHKNLKKTKQVSFHKLAQILAQPKTSSIMEISKAYKILYKHSLVDDLRRRLKGNAPDVMVAIITPIPDFNKIWLPFTDMPNDVISNLVYTSKNELGVLRSAYKRLTHLIKVALHTIAKHRFGEQQNVPIGFISNGGTQGISETFSENPSEDKHQSHAFGGVQNILQSLKNNFEQIKNNEAGGKTDLTVYNIIGVLKPNKGAADDASHKEPTLPPPGEESNDVSSCSKPSSGDSSNNNAIKTPESSEPSSADSSSNEANAASKPSEGSNEQSANNDANVTSSSTNNDANVVSSSSASNESASNNVLSAASKPSGPSNDTSSTNESNDVSKPTMPSSDIPSSTQAIEGSKDSESSSQSSSSNDAANLSNPLSVNSVKKTSKPKPKPKPNPKALIKVSATKKPIATVKPSKKPIAVSKPAAAKPSDDSKPADSKKGTIIYKSPPTSKPVEYKKPTLVYRPTTVSKPIDASETEQPKKLDADSAPQTKETPKPADALIPLQTPKPAEAAQPTEASKLNEALQKTEASKPTESPKPTEAPKPAEPKKPTSGSKPTAAKPVQKKTTKKPVAKPTAPTKTKTVTKKPTTPAKPSSKPKLPATTSSKGPSKNVVSTTTKPANPSNSESLNEKSVSSSSASGAASEETVEVKEKSPMYHKLQQELSTIGFNVQESDKLADAALATPAKLYAQKIEKCSSNPKEVRDILATWSDERRKETLEILQISSSDIIDKLVKCLGVSKEIIRYFVEANHADIKDNDSNAIKAIIQQIHDSSKNGCKPKDTMDMFKNIARLSEASLRSVATQYREKYNESVDEVLNKGTCSNSKDMEMISVYLNTFSSKSTYFGKKLCKCMSENDLSNNDYCTAIITSRSQIDLNEIKDSMENTCDVVKSPDLLKKAGGKKYWELTTTMVKLYYEYKTYWISEKRMTLSIKSKRAEIKTINTCSNDDLTMGATNLEKSLKSTPCDLQQILTILTNCNSEQRSSITKVYQQNTGKDLLKNLEICAGNDTDLSNVLKALAMPFEEFYVQELLQSKNAIIDLLITFDQKKIDAISQVFELKTKQKFVEYVISKFPLAPKEFIRQLINVTARNPSEDVDELQAKFDAEFLSKAENLKKLHYVGEIFALRSYVTIQKMIVLLGSTRHLKTNLPADFYELIENIIIKARNIQDHIGMNVVYYMNKLRHCIQDTKIINKRDLLRILISRSEIDLMVSAHNQFKGEIVKTVMAFNENLNYLRSLIAIMSPRDLHGVFHKMPSFQVNQNNPEASIYPAYGFKSSIAADTLNDFIVNENIYELITALTRYSQMQRMEIIKELKKPSMDRMNALSASENFKQLLSIMSKPLAELYANALGKQQSSDILIEILVTLPQDMLKQTLNFYTKIRGDVTQKVQKLLQGVPEAMIKALLSGNKNIEIDDQQAIKDADYLLPLYKGNSLEVLLNDGHFVNIFAQYSYVSLRKVLVELEVNKDVDVRALSSKIPAEYKKLLSAIIEAAISTPAYLAKQLKRCLNENYEIINLENFNRIIVGRSEIDLRDILQEFRKMEHHDLLDLLKMNGNEKFYLLLIASLTNPWKMFDIKFSAENTKYVQIQNRYNDGTIQQYEHFKSQANLGNAEYYLHRKQLNEFIDFWVRFSADQRYAIVKAYNSRHTNANEGMFDVLRQMFKGAAYDIIEALSTPLADFYANDLNERKNGIIDILATLKYPDIQSISMAYKRLYKQSVEQKLQKLYTPSAMRLIKLLITKERKENEIIDETKLLQDAEFLKTLKGAISAKDEKRIFDIFSLYSFDAINNMAGKFKIMTGQTIEEIFKDKLDKDLYLILTAIIRASASTAKYFSDQLMECMKLTGIEKPKCLNRIYVGRSEIDLRGIMTNFKAAAGKVLHEQLEIKDNIEWPYIYTLVKIVNPHHTYDVKVLESTYTKKVVEKVKMTTVHKTTVKGSSKSK